MCGILFYIGKRQELSLRYLKRRGPDAYREVDVGDYHACFCRLSIITSGGKSEWTTPDSSGDQPLANEDWYVMANGEFYNYKEVATFEQIDVQGLRSDIDILTKFQPHDISTWLHRLNGDFAGVLFTKDRYIAFRDPLGVKPLYVGYNESKDIVAFSSLKSAIAEVEHVKTIEEFPPGHYYDSHLCMFQSYIDFTDVDAFPKVLNPSLAQEGILAHLTESVRRRLLHSNVPVAFLCSGGIDSSILLTIGHRIWTMEMNRPAKHLQVFSIEFDDPKCPSRDTFYAKLLTSSLGVSHTVFKFSKQDIIDSLEDIVSILETDDYRSVRAAIPQYFLGREISKTPYKVILSGEGADELFLGYNYFYKCPSAQDAEKESQRLVRNLHRYDVLRADRTISSWGLELRVPFLDTQFVHFVQAIEGGVRGYTVREKDLLRKSFQGLRALRTTSILERDKEKFSDGCGLSYIPTLMNIIASKYVDADVLALKSAHMLEVYEEQFVKEFHTNAYGKFEVQSNHKHRELPAWAEVPVENTLVGFSTKKDLRPLIVVSYEELLKNAQS